MKPLEGLLTSHKRIVLKDSAVSILSRHGRLLYLSLYLSLSLSLSLSFFLLRLMQCVMELRYSFLGC